MLRRAIFAVALFLSFKSYADAGTTLLRGVRVRVIRGIAGGSVRIREIPFSTN